MPHIDLNADLGEGFQTDGQLMPLLDSCSIACGGHAGDDSSIQASLLLAREFGVKAGPHPGYPDPKHFGRRVLSIGRLDLYRSLVKQLKAYLEHSKALGVPVHHVKLHGALYHQANANTEMALLVWDSLTECLAPTKIYLPPQSAMQASLPDGWEVWTEAFLDRNYTPEYNLVPRSMPDALLDSVEAMMERYQDLRLKAGLKTIDGNFIELKADTLCLHGDGPLTVQIATAIQAERTKS